MSDSQSGLQQWHSQLLSRRRFLLGLAGGSVAALFPAVCLPLSSKPATIDEWAILGQVQQHLLPDEADSPGAVKIHALDYLRFVVQDPWVDADERQFIVQGSHWLEDLAHSREQTSFLLLDQARREQLLQQIADSSAGENWLSTLLLYLMEALLTDPAYGGNPAGTGWQWLQHTPGYPRPPADKIYPKLNV
ncbi:MAG: gluconate 2-dehydrogenase subunit 3 family protein [gamma proteobacterium symbiont of Bathyaustriella thionipta]|nr:gluconate 2-dehydrogenase subunit 3 family protein [gamma proteobacterium symbiont of Bathyaustriella thionipta]